MLRRLNALLFRALVATLPGESFLYTPYTNAADVGYEGAFHLKSSGRVVAFVKQGQGLEYGWCDYNWFSLGTAR
jgi:hypothetical protein